MNIYRDEGVYCFRDFLMETNNNGFCSLRVLNLAQNKLTDISAKLFLEVIQINSQLQELYLKGNQFSPAMEDLFHQVGVLVCTTKDNQTDGIS